MKTSVSSLMALSFAVSMTGQAEGCNVELLVPIADAIATTYVSDRPTGAVQFFFATQKSPEILIKLGSYLAAPRTGASGRSDQREVMKPFSGHWSIWKNARNEPALMLL
jgi:hypothetical protein